MDTPRRRLVAAVIAAVLLSSLVAALVLNGSDRTDTAPRSAPPPAVTPAPLLTLERDLAEPGDREVGLPRAGTDTIRGCTTQFIQHNFSARGGAAVKAISAHYTVSRPGSGPAIVAMFGRVGTDASSNFVIDTNGSCWYIVPLSLKAWTQVNGNPFTASIEFVAVGTEGKLTAAALAKGGLVISQVAQRYKIPLQLGDVTGCAPVRPGVVDHAMYGVCGGGHHDLRPFYGTHVPRRPSEDARALGPLITSARANGITATDRVTCRKLNWWRSHGRPHGLAERNAVRRRNALTARGVRCLTSGPVRA